MPLQPKEPEVILQVGGEGGDYTIVGEQCDGNWRFWRAAGGGDSWLLDDDDGDASTPLPKVPASEPAICYFETLDGVLAEINSCWPHLRPQQVHPAFAQEIWRRAIRYWRENQGSSRTQYVLPAWSDKCLGRKITSLDELDWVGDETPGNGDDKDPI